MASYSSRLFCVVFLATHFANLGPLADDTVVCRDLVTADCPDVVA